jgi:hypothetical protein
VQIRIFDDRLNNIGGDFAQGLGRRSNRNCAAQSAGDGADRRDMIKEILACPGLLQWRPVTGDASSPSCSAWRLIALTMASSLLGCNIGSPKSSWPSSPTMTGKM